MSFLNVYVGRKFAKYFKFIKANKKGWIIWENQSLRSTKFTFTHSLTIVVSSDEVKFMNLKRVYGLSLNDSASSISFSLFKT